MLFGTPEKKLRKKVNKLKNLVGKVLNEKFDPIQKTLAEMEQKNPSISYLKKKFYESNKNGIYSISDLMNDVYFLNRTENEVIEKIDHPRRMYWILDFSTFESRDHVKEYLQKCSKDIYGKIIRKQIFSEFERKYLPNISIIKERFILSDDVQNETPSLIELKNLLEKGNIRADGNKKYWEEDLQFAQHRYDNCFYPIGGIYDTMSTYDEKENNRKMQEDARRDIKLAKENLKQYDDYYTNFEAFEDKAKKEGIDPFFIQLIRDYVSYFTMVKDE